MTSVSVIQKSFSELTEGINLNSRNRSTSGPILSQPPPTRRSQYFNCAQFQRLSVCFQLLDTRYVRCRPAKARGTNGTDSASQGRVRPEFSLAALVLIYITNSKMVNVNARLPFNLHNKHLSSITNTVDRHASSASSSKSRSVSTSTSNRGRGLVPLSPILHSHAQIQAHVGGPLTIVPSNNSLVDFVTDSNAAGSRSSSMASRGTSVSTRGHDSETSKGGVLRSPVIHARLVRRPGLGIGSVAAAAAARRGRSKKKKKSGGGDAPSSPTPAGAANSRPEQPLEQAAPTSLTSTVQDQTPRLPYSAAPIIGVTTDEHPTLSVSPASTSGSTSTSSDLDLKLQNVGSLAVSWGE